MIKLFCRQLKEKASKTSEEAFQQGLAP